MAQLTATSPALTADRIKTPFFIAQGAKEPRVVKAESDQMVEALKKVASKWTTWLRTTKATASVTRKTSLSFMAQWRNF